MSTHSISDQSLRIFHENNRKLNFLIDEVKEGSPCEQHSDLNSTFLTFSDSLTPARITIQDTDSKSFELSTTDRAFLSP